MQGTFNQLDEPTKVELWSCMALRHTAGLGLRRRGRLRAEFGSAHAALSHCADWGRLGIGRESIQAYKTEAWREPAKKEWAGFKKLGCGILTWEAFPRLLQEIHDPPLYLYYWGQPSLLAAPHIAVVGSRRCSRLGLHNAAMLARDLAGAGFSVVSGLARGIDREAHLAALPEIGSSIAVLGAGIDIKYPKENSDAFDALAENGLILSELPPSTPPDPRNFPVRNRIISGISLGVVVIEAAGRSGSLITARHALEQNRQVYAVPGNPDAESSSGCQELLRNGAVLTRRASDIIFDLKGQLKAFTLAASSQAAAEAAPVVIPSPEASQEAARRGARDISRGAKAGDKTKKRGPARHDYPAQPACLKDGLSKTASPPLPLNMPRHALQKEESCPDTDHPESLGFMEARILGILRANPDGLQIDQLTRLVENMAQPDNLTASPDIATADQPPGVNAGSGAAQGSTGRPCPVSSLLPAGQASGWLAGLLTMLEVAGKVVCKPGLRYVAR